MTTERIFVYEDVKDRFKQITPFLNCSDYVKKTLTSQRRCRIITSIDRLSVEAIADKKSMEGQRR